MKHTICRKVRNFKKQNTILVTHLNKTLKLSNLIHIYILLFISFISIGNAFIIGASITTVCFAANGIVFIYLTSARWLSVAQEARVMVKFVVSYYNPQITKARVNNLTLQKSKITLNSGLCMFTIYRNINNFLNSFVSNDKKMKSFKQLIYNHTLFNNHKSKGNALFLKKTQILNPLLPVRCNSHKQM